MRWPLRTAVVLVVATPAALASGQESHDSSRLSVDRIFATREFESESVAARWLPDGSGYTTWEPAREPGGGRDLVRHDPATGDKEVLVPAAHLVPAGESEPLHVEDYALSPDRSRLLVFTNTKRVWRRNTRGDYWVLDRSSRELRKLGGRASPSTLMFAKFAPVGRKVAYVAENRLYVEDLQTRMIVPLAATDSADVITGTFDWVYEEELNLRDGYRWSPDGRSIAFWELNTAGVREFPLVNNAAGLYPEVKTIKYPKVGETNAACRVGVVSAGGGEPVWMDVPGDQREHYIAFMEWDGNSDDLRIQQLNRLQNVDLVLRARARTGKVETVVRESDDAWVDLQEEVRGLDGGGFLWLSERDGWRHVYKVDRAGSKVDLVTPGDFDVVRVAGFDRRGGWLYVIASPDNPTQRYLYRVRLDGTGRQRVTPADQAGTHEYDVSPDACWAVHRFSTVDKPPVTDLVRLPSHERVRVLASNAKLSSKLETLKKTPTEFFRVDGGGGALDAWLIRPTEFDPSKSYPLVVHVYGEPAGQTVVDAWTGANHLWHRMLAQEGYAVLSVDNRGTASPRGRAWRKAVHRQLGILAPREQAEALKAVLRDRPWLDPKRVGVWGWSGGGSMSLNAVFQFPDLYAAAVAVAPVANQRLYDTIYQERYMGLPADNVDGYTRGSPIHHAHRLKGHLLLIHGTGDDNCHYQGTEALINELIRLDKPFSMMAYPNRTHSIHEGRNTTRHLRALMTHFLRDKLPPGPSPR